MIDVSAALFIPNEAARFLEIIGVPGESWGICRQSDARCRRKAPSAQKIERCEGTNGRSGDFSCAICEID